MLRRLREDGRERLLLGEDALPGVRDRWRPHAGQASGYGLRGGEGGGVVTALRLLVGPVARAVVCFLAGCFVALAGEAAFLRRWQDALYALACAVILGMIWWTQWYFWLELFAGREGDDAE